MVMSSFFKSIKFETGIEYYNILLHECIICLMQWWKKTLIEELNSIKNEKNVPTKENE